MVKDSCDEANRPQKRRVPGLLGMNVLPFLIESPSNDSAETEALDFSRSFLSCQIKASYKSQEIVAFVKSVGKPVFVFPESSTIVDVKCDVSYQKAIVEPLTNSEHLPAGVLIPATITDGSFSFEVTTNEIHVSKSVDSPVPMSSEFDILVDLSGLQGGEDQCLKLRHCF